jgi:hypothetical protein
MEATRFMTCAHCAKRIGSYEPLWWQRPDGTLAPSSLLRAREDPEFDPSGSSFFHPGCLPGADGAGDP